METEITKMVRNTEGNFIVVTNTRMPNGKKLEGILRGEYTEGQLINEIGMTIDQISNLLSL